jgi:hypothetical protein
MKKLPYFLLIFIIGTILVVLFTNNTSSVSKMNGVSFVAPRNIITANQMLPVKELNANWIAVTPYAFSKSGFPEVTFNYDRQWWGERMDGCAETINFAHSLGLKVMLKPHVWVRGEGWAGDFDLKSEEEWQRWEKSYSLYILSNAKLADSLNVELLCIGTEYRKAAIKRPLFWKDLIVKVRDIYSGDITYAANWDNYENITFWGDLDYIGIDAYFPLTSIHTPDVETLNREWIQHKLKIADISKKFDKPILFTEFGYQSVDFTADGHWKYDQDTLLVNMQAQNNAYKAIFSSFWSEEWFSGGFLWKWHSAHDQSGGVTCKRFTPQNKPSQALIKSWFDKNGAY